MIVNKDIDYGKPFDWGRISEEYARYRDIYPQEFYDKIIELGLCVPGQNVLDIGTGTGVLPRNLYRYGARFTGADVSENQIRLARELSQNQKMDIDYVVSPVEDIDFPDKSFDVVTACQCFMYFNQQIAIPKIHNVLKDDGCFAILFMVWLPNESEIAKNSEELVLKYNPDWTGAGAKRQPLAEPDFISDPNRHKSLFTIKDSVAFDINVTFTRQGWHGRMKACRGIGASSLNEDAISSWEKEHKNYIATLPDSFEIIHYCTIQTFNKI